MTTNQTRVPLPEPAFRLLWKNGEYKVSKPNIDDTDAFTAEQMQAYADACVAAALSASSQAEAVPVGYLLFLDEGAFKQSIEHHGRRLISLSEAQSYGGGHIVAVYTHPPAAPAEAKDAILTKVREHFARNDTLMFWGSAVVREIDAAMARDGGERG